MALLELSPEERAFLALPMPGFATGSARAGSADFAVHLGQQIARTLHARLRMPLHLEPCEHAAGSVTRPQWRVARGLAGLWLARRLGGTGSPPFCLPGSSDYVPPALLRTLNAVLAEGWLDHPVALPTGCAWRCAILGSDSVLTLDLPASEADMQRWAREIIAS